MCFSVATLSLAATVLHGYGPLLAEGAGVLDLRQSPRAFRDRVDELAKLPLCGRASLAECVVPFLRDGSRRQFPDYVYPAEGHDLSTTAGRAAYFLDRLLDFELPPLRPKATRQDRETLYRLGVSFSDSLRRGLEASAQAAELKRPQRDDLKALGERIRQGLSGKRPQDGIDALDELLHKWCPIGRTRAELEALIGRAAADRLGGFEYLFSGQSGDVSCRFYSDKRGAIQAVVKCPLRGQN